MEEESEKGQHPAPETVPAPQEPYRSPELRVIGTVEEITQGNNDNPADMNAASSNAG